MNNPTTISTGGNLTVTDPNVIINGIVPNSISLGGNLTQYYIFNSTSSSIPIGFSYVDFSENIQTSIPPLTHLQIQQYTDGTWHQYGNPDSIFFPPRPFVLPIARPGVLGGVRGGGANIQIASDGTISATASPYSLPIASASVLGGIKVGANLTINSITGELDASIGGGITQLTGDVLAGPGGGSQASTLASIISSGTFGDSTHTVQLTVDAKGRITAITNVGIPGLTATSLPKASDLGITTSGDQTATLNSIFSNTQYEGIIMDFVSEGAVTINGTVNCLGKKILFQPGSYFTGPGIINQPYFFAGRYQKILDVSVSVTNAICYNDEWSSLWYGYTLGTADTAYSLQKTLDTVIANGTRTFKFVNGNHIINQPLIGYTWDGANYQEITCSIEGESSFWQGRGGTTLTCNSGMENYFAFGIQLGKGVQIKNIKFNGRFTPPFTSGPSLYNCTFPAFTDGVCIDTVNAVHAGIVIDPFGRTTPAGGNYPNITSYNGTINFYRGGGTGGTTGTIIEDCFITNFVGGYIGSPSGETANAELLNMNKIQFFACKFCVAGCQDQEKLNKIEFAACWGQTHTFFTSGVGSGDGYGAITSGNWYIKGVNIAGAMNTFINRIGTGFFPMYVRDVYAESLGVVGRWDGTQGDSMENCLFDFVDLATMPQYPQVGYHFISSGKVTIKNSSFRYYGTNNRMVFNGGYFENCSFNDVPVMFAGALKDCNIYNGAATGICNPSYDIYDSRAGYQNYYACGRYQFFDINQLNTGKEISMKISKNNTPIGFLSSDGIVNSPSGVVVSGTTATITPPTAADLNRITVGGLIFNGTQVIGVVESIGVSTYVVQYVPANVTNGSYVLSQAYSIYGLSFMGTCSHLTNTITNVVADFGVISNFISQGGFCRIQGFYQFRGYSQGARMLSYNAGTGVITMDRNASEDGTNIYFTNNQAIKEINQTSDGSGPGSAISNTEIMPKGSRLFDEVPTNGGRREFIVTATGYFVNSPTYTSTELT